MHIGAHVAIYLFIIYFCFVIVLVLGSGLWHDFLTTDNVINFSPACTLMFILRHIFVHLAVAKIKQFASYLMPRQIISIDTNNTLNFCCFLHKFMTFCR